MLLNCSVEDSWESLGLQGDPSVHPKGDQSWVFIGRTDAEVATPILWPPDVKSWLIWKDPDAGKDWGREEKGTTGWDGWMASPTRWTWVWVNSGNWWWSGRPGLLWSMGSRRVGHDWATELNWTELNRWIRYLNVKNEATHYHLATMIVIIKIFMDAKTRVKVWGMRKTVWTSFPWR